MNNGIKRYASEQFVEEKIAALGNNTELLNEAKSYTDTKVAALVDSAPDTLDTFGELATAFTENKDVVEALDAAITNKANASDLTDHVNNSDIHVTIEDKDAWNSAEANAKAYVDEKIAALGTLGNNTDLLNEAKAYVDEKVAEVVNSAPETLDTIGELATAFTENKEVVETLNTAITNKQDKTNMITNISSDSTDDQYPSAKAVFDHVNDKLAEGVGLKTAEGGEIFNDYTNNSAVQNAHAEGFQTEASGIVSHTEGENTIASGKGAHAEGGACQAIGDYSHAEGCNDQDDHRVLASGKASHAEGAGTTASGDGSHAEGNSTIASGSYAHAEGYETQATNGNTHAEGFKTVAAGLRSHAEGNTSQTGEDATAAHAEGWSTQALGVGSHTEGVQTIAKGNYSHAEGGDTIANGNYQHVQGKYNIEDTEKKYAHIVGNGTSDTDRSNAHTVDWDGNAEYKGDVVANGCGGENPISLVGLSEIVSNMETKEDASKKLTEAKSYADSKVAELVDSAPETMNTIGELATAFNENKEVIDTLDAAITNKANTSDLTSHTGNTTVHITSTERTNWNDANTKKHSHSNKTVLDNTTASFTTEEKNKLAGIANGANAYTLPSAGSTLGGVKTGGDVTITDGQITVNDGSHNHAASNITSGTLSSDRLPTVPISKGGTGATTAANALINLGLTATAAELNYVDGVTSNIQTQLNSKFNGITNVSTADTDLNDYIEPGIYYFASEYVPINVPAGSNGWLIVITAYNNALVKQIWLRHGTSGSNDHETYTRLLGRDKDGVSNWSNWERYLTEKGGTMTGKLNLVNGSSIVGDDGVWSSLAFKTTDDNIRGSVMLSGENEIHFNVKETDSSFADRYLLPAPTTDLTKDTWYRILTTKSPVTIAQGGTGATTADGILTNLGITATAAELNKLDGVTATTTELNYVDGVTSNIQTQLNSKFNGITNVSTADTDLNDYIETGIYFFRTGVVPTNIPAGSNGWLIVLNYNNSVIKQLWLRYGSANTTDYETYTRLGTYTSNVWSWGSWDRYLTEKGGTMTGKLNLVNGSGILGDDGVWSSLAFVTTAGKTRGSVMLSAENKIHFNVKETDSTYSDRYLLPAPTTDLTKDVWYSILTSKSPVTIAQGGTGATTAAGALTNLGITATAAELNKLDGVTATTTELNYVDGVTSNIQEQINEVNDLVGTSILSESKNVYVSPSGSDTTGDGTSTKPWKTISKAVEYGPVARNGYGIYYTINIAAGTYTENITISDKKIQFNLLGDVIIQSSSNVHAILGIYRNSRLSIISDPSNKKSLTLKDGTIGIHMNYESTLVFSELSNLIFDNITDTCIFGAHNAYLYINNDGTNNNTLEKITISSTCKLKNIAKITNNSYAELHTTMDINTSSTCSSYAFSAISNSYLYICNLTIPSTYSKGIYVSHMGRINPINVINNATTKTQTLLGGVIAE